MGMKYLVLAALVAGCGPASQAGNNDLGDGDMAQHRDDMGNIVTADMASKCTWLLTSPNSTGGLVVESTVFVGSPQCVPSDSLLYLDFRLGDRTEQQFLFHPKEVTPYGMGLFYRSIPDGSAQPEVTCGKWSGTGSAVVENGVTVIVLDLLCTEDNSGHWNWRSDGGAAPDTRIKGKFTFPN